MQPGTAPTSRPATSSTETEAGSRHQVINRDNTKQGHQEDLEGHKTVESTTEEN